MRLRSRASFVTHTRDSEPPASISTRVTRWVYTCALLFAVAYLLWYLIDRSLHIIEEGEIIVDSVNLAAVKGGRITALSVSEHSQFRAGDVLVVVNQEHCQPPVPSATTQQRLQRELSVVQAKRNSLRKEQGILSTTLAGMDVRRALELDPDAARTREQLARDLQQTHASLDILQAELDARQAELAATPPIPPANPCAPELLQAPFAGSVRSQLKQTHEVVTRSEPILILRAHQAPVRIRLYLAADEHPDLQPGETLTLQLPDGSHSLGMVAEVISSASDQANTARDNYRAVKPELLVWLRPTDHVAADQWRLFDRMTVTIRGQR